MSTYQIARVDQQGSKSYISGALTYMEAQRKVNDLVRSENSHKRNFSIDIFMPNRETAAAPAQEAKFSEIYEMELEVKRSTAGEAFGVDAATRERAKADTKKFKAALYAALDTLTTEEGKAYSNYRLNQGN